MAKLNSKSIADSAPAELFSLNDLEQRQDRLLSELDALNGRIEAALSVYGSAVNQDREVA